MTIQEIESAIQRLPPAEFLELASWFAEYQASVWDQRLEHDYAAGKLQKWIDLAKDEHAAGRCKPL
jgi:hypothetical protein